MSNLKKSSEHIGCGHRIGKTWVPCSFFAEGCVLRFPGPESCEPRKRGRYWRGEIDAAFGRKPVDREADAE